VLYEMLGGQPAFGGEDVTTTLARVLEREAKLDSLPADVSPHVRHTIKLCLEKDPSKRIADIRDVRLALEGRFESDSRVAAAQGKADRSRGRGALLLAAGLVAGAVIVGAAGFALWPGPAPQPITRLAMSVAPGANPFLQVSISRDGSRIGFRAGNPAQIFVRRLDEFEARPVSGAQAGTAPWPPCFSPDGTSLAYSVLGGEIKKVPLAGGAALTVAEGLDTPDWCDWADDGYIYFGVNAGIMRVAESGGETEMVAAFDAASGEVSAELPQLLPGGRQLLFTVLGSDGLANPDLAVLNLETRERSALIRGAGYATYAPTGPGATQGHLVYGRSGALFAAPFDLSTLEAGPASPVLEGIRATGPTSFVGVSDTGTLAYLVGASTAIGTLLQWVDRTGAAGPLPEGVHAYGSVALSPDGQRAAVDIFDFETLTVDLWVYELDGDRLTRLTFGGLNGPAVWTPDGQRLVYWHAETISATAGELRVVPGDNSAPPATLVAVQEAAAIPTSISFDGTVLIGTRNRGANNSDIWALSLDASTATDAASPAIDDVLGTNFNEREARLSPDGRHIAYTSNESGRDEIYVVPYPGPGGKTQVSTAGGRLPRWNPNGRELFYVSGTSLMAVDVETAPVFRRLTPKVLFEAPQLASTNADSYDIAPDGSRFLMEAIPESAEGEQVDIRIVVNWFEELRKLAPWPERDQ
jgi:serine/threonine-protein kinase